MILFLLKKILESESFKNERLAQIIAGAIDGIFISLIIVILALSSIRTI